MEFMRMYPEGIVENRVELYKLVRGPAENVNRSKGEKVKISAYLHYAEEREDGPREILTMMGEDGRVFRTVSKTFIRSFFDIVDNFIAVPEIEFCEGMSKSGRPFVDCTLIG